MKKTLIIIFLIVLLYLSLFYPTKEEIKTLPQTPVIPPAQPWELETDTPPAVVPPKTIPEPDKPKRKILHPRTTS